MAGGAAGRRDVAVDEAEHRCREGDVVTLQLDTIQREPQRRAVLTPRWQQRPDTASEHQQPTTHNNYASLSCTFLSYLILSYLILSYLILSYFILSYLILSYLIVSYLILSYLILSYLISSYLILSYPILSYLILSYIILLPYPYPYP